jgi:erythromycin esterase-like protein
MAQNLLDIRNMEDRRGATLVFAHNVHLQRNPSHMRMGDMDIDWLSAGAIVASLVGERYTFVAGSLGRSGGIGLREPEADTDEGILQYRITTWDLTTATSARTRPDTTDFPLDLATLDDADAVLEVSAGYPDPVAANISGAARRPR